MKNTLMSKDELQLLPFNNDDLTSIFASLGYTQQNISKDKDSMRVMIDIGCNFVDQIIDYCKMMNIKQLKLSHIDKAVKMKFRHSDEMKQDRQKDIQRLKMRGIQLQKVDEKSNNHNR